MKNKKSLLVGFLFILILFLFLFLILNGFSNKKAIPTHEAHNYGIIKNKKKTFIVEIDEHCEENKPCYKKIKNGLLGKKKYEININLHNDKEIFDTIGINQHQLELNTESYDRLELVGIIDQTFLIYGFRSGFKENLYEFVVYDKDINPVAFFHSNQQHAKFDFEKQFNYQHNELALFFCKQEEDMQNVLIKYLVWFDKKGIKDTIISEEKVEDCGAHQ